MSFREAFIQEQGNGRLKVEEQLVVEYLSKKDIPIIYFTEKFIRRRSLSLSTDSLVVADIPCMHGAMKQLNLDLPIANSYPKSLLKYMHRDFWESDLARFTLELMDGLSKPLFVKPSDTQKKFTGRVFESVSDLYFISNCSKNTRILCSDVVNWISEFRVYVVDSKIVGIAYYDGDASVKLDETVVENAIKDLDKAGESYAGYGIDFGVLDSGETALIEMNDGYGLGAYEIESSAYGRLVEARWGEIVESKNS